MLIPSNSMAVEWSSYGPDLLLALDRASGLPLRMQLEEQLRTAVRSGRLLEGERLPSSRTLAGHVGLSRSVVQQCYEQLVAEGYFVSRAGSATRVAAIRTHRPEEPSPAPASPARRLIADFASGVPDLATAPREDWAWAVREACRSAPNTAFDYGDPRGEHGLRDVLAAYARRVRAVDTTAEHIVVCAGYQQGLTVVLRALAGSGRLLVAVEDPGSIGTVTAAARAAHGDCVPVPVDEFGIDVDVLEKTGAQVAVVTPAHQWPTGVVLTSERRHALIAWARRRNGVIVEDDYDAEYRYDREPVGSLQGLAPDCVVSIGTVSKSLAPAIRLGWAVLPPRLAGAVGAAKQVADRGSPTLDQLALATLIESGRYDRHIRRMRGEYARRRDALVTSLATHAPQVELTGLAAGFHAVAHLPPGAQEEAVVARALDARVRLYGMSLYRASRATTPTQLVLGWGNTNIRAVDEGIRRVGALLT